MARREIRGRIQIVRGSGNVFEDVGFPKDEALSLLLRADLMLRVERFVRARGMTRPKAAKALRVTRARLEHLLKHRIELFSLDALVKMLANAGMRVELRVSKSR